MFDQGGGALILGDVVLVVPPDEILLAAAAHRADHCGNQRWRSVPEEEVDIEGGELVVG